MNNQHREIARILKEEIRFDPPQGPTVGNAIERLAGREKIAFSNGSAFAAKWIVAISIVAIIITLAVFFPAKPTPANIEQQLTDTIPVASQIVFRDTAKTPYYFNDSACLTHPRPQIVLSQKQYLDTVAAGTTLYVDSAKSNDSAWVYVFGIGDTLIWVPRLPAANKL